MFSSALRLHQRLVSNSAFLSVEVSQRDYFVKRKIGSRGASLYQHFLKRAGPGQNQPGGVAVSGAAISQTITFVANGSLSQNIPFTLTDDSVADEPDEVYFLVLSDPSPQVSLGDAAEITILDDDDNGNITHEHFISTPLTAINLLHYSPHDPICPDDLLI